MSDSDTVAAAAAAAAADAPSNAPENESVPQPQEPKKPSTGGITLSIWPPTQRTRDAVVNRLIETLSTPSVLSKRYGTIPKDEAEAAARRIEEEAFSVANNASASGEDDGLEILQSYSKEISRRMLDTVKARAAETPSPAVEPPVAAAAEEASNSVEAEA